MAIGKRIETILVKNGYVTDKGDIDFKRIAKEGVSAIGSIQGIGDTRLKRIAQELVIKSLVDAEESWLSQVNVMPNSVREDSGHTTEKLANSLGKDLESSPDLRSIYYPIIGPSNFSDDVFQWIHDTIGIEKLTNYIEQKIEALGISAYYLEYQELQGKLNSQGNSNRQEIIIKLLLSHNLYRVQKHIKIAFTQGYWKASIVDILHKEAMQKPLPTVDMQKITAQISRVVSKLQKLNYKVSDTL